MTGARMLQRHLLPATSPTNRIPVWTTNDREWDYEQRQPAGAHTIKQGRAVLGALLSVCIRFGAVMNSLSLSARHNYSL